MTAARQRSRLFNTIVVTFGLCAACPSASAQQPVNPESVIEEIARAYKFVQPYEVTSEQFEVASGSVALYSMNADQILASRGRRIEPITVTAHPSLGILIDKLDPTQRRSSIGPFGTLVTRTAYYSISPKKHAQSVRTEIPNELAIRATSALYSPGSIPFLVKWKAEGAHPVAALGPDAMIHLKEGDTEFLVDPKNSAVVGWDVTELSGLTVQTRIVAFQPTSIFSVPFPKVAYTKATVRGGEPFYTIVAFGVPKGLPGISEETFHWWTYAESARDSKTGEVFGPNDVLLVNSSPAPDERHAMPAALRTDPETVRANALDPSQPVLPKVVENTATKLRIVGLVFFVLALAWFLRKRLR